MGDGQCGIDTMGTSTWLTSMPMWFALTWLTVNAAHVDVADVDVAHVNVADMDLVNVRRCSRWGSMWLVDVAHVVLSPPSVIGSIGLALGRLGCCWVD